MRWCLTSLIKIFGHRQTKFIMFFVTIPSSIKLNWNECINCHRQFLKTKQITNCTDIANESSQWVVGKLYRYIFNNIG